MGFISQLGSSMNHPRRKSATNEHQCFGAWSVYVVFVVLCAFVISCVGCGYAAPGSFMAIYSGLFEGPNSGSPLRL